MGSPIVRLVTSKVVRVTALIVCITIGIGIVRSVYSLSQKKGIIAERQKVLVDLTAKNRQLQEDLREATSAAFVEQQARNKLGLVREGETVVIMDRTQNSELNDQKTQEKLPSWKLWWRLFF